MSSMDRNWWVTTSLTCRMHHSEVCQYFTSTSIAYLHSSPSIVRASDVKSIVQARKRIPASSPASRNPIFKDFSCCEEAPNSPSRHFLPALNPPPRVDLLAAPTGRYFFYGTLADPSMLCDILELKTAPELRPAYLIGYECKL
ncbi:hypothetical protein BJX96DRAFT_143280 [Aspergillus floccosus]